MSAIPVSLMDPIWQQIVVLLPVYPTVAPTHPVGCHLRRISGRVVFDHVVAALVHGSGYERIATPGCSDRTIRRRVRAWVEAGLATELHALVLVQFDRMFGFDLEDLVVPGGITTSPCGGETAGRSPVDRGKQGLKRSTVTDAAGIPLHLVSAGANRHDAPLLAPTLQGLGLVGPLPPGIKVHRDRGYDSAASRTLVAELGLTGVIAGIGTPAPIQAGSRWVVERTQAWMNGCGKLRRCTERCGTVVNFALSLAAALVVTRCLIRHARTRFRWPNRPTTRRLR